MNFAFKAMRCTVVVLVLWIEALRALAAMPLSMHYLVDVWDTENGLPSSTVTSIAQTPDGYLWVGTYNGLARFDGARFVTFDPVNTPQLTQTRVQALSLDADGTLWITTFRGGLTSYRNGVFRSEWPDQPQFDLHTTLVSSSSNQVTFVTQYGEILRRNPLDTNSAWEVETPVASPRPIYQCVDKGGTLWFLTREGHILQFTNGTFVSLKNDGGLGRSRIYTLVADAHGAVWAGAENKIARWSGDRFVDMTPTNSATDIQPSMLFPTRAGAIWVLDGGRLRKMQGRRWTAEATAWRGLLGSASGRAMGTHEDRDGGVWFNHYGNGLFYITPDGQYQRITTQNGLPGDRVGAWFQSSDGGIWAGVDRGGLVRLRDRHFQAIGSAQGLPVRTALSVCQGADGAIWIGTAGGGLCRWFDGKITSYPVGTSASANFVFSIFPLPDGDMWLSAAEGEDLYEFTNGEVRHAPWEVHGVKSIMADHQGRLWLGTKTGVAYEAGNLRKIFSTNTNGMYLPAMRALAQKPDGTVWAGADDGSIFLCEPDKLTPFHPDDALADQPIYSMIADDDGTIWAGTFRGGLLRFHDGKFFRYTFKQGLPVDVISQILDDGRGHLWLGTHQGIYCVSKSELNAIANGHTTSLNYVTYGRHDGLPSLECSDGYQPACWRGTNGTLWFTTVHGVVSVNPADLIAKTPPPPVFIEEVRVDGELVSLTDKKFIVPPGRKQLDFRFTALSFDAGNLARFRYRIEGLDPDWVDIDTRRTAQIRNLPPGSYRFQVIACNSEGVWNETGASVTFEVEPFFYQTWWFKILATFLLLGGVTFAARRAATRKYRRKLAQMEKQHAVERDRTRIAKDIHDDIGAGLTQITLLTELARREPEQTNANLERITDSARRLTRAMDEIVWAVDPQHDTVAGLMDYASAYTEDFLRVAGIRCRMDLPLTLPAMPVDAELRYNLFLALKETLNNIVKHAQASEVCLRLKLKERALTVVIEDNGCGIAAAGPAESDRLSSGSGLGNLGRRLESVGGRCHIESEPGRGTRVELTVFLKEETSPVVAIGTNNLVD